MNLAPPHRALFTLAGLLLGLAAGAVRADNPANGAALYAANCANNCHLSSPLTSNQKKIYNGRNARAVIDAAISNVGDMNSLRSTFAAGSQGLADIAAYLGNTPTSLTFGSTAVGSTSAAQTVTVYASLKTGNALSGLAVNVNGDFARNGGTCGTSVAVGQNCTVGVVFAPTASGTRTGTLSITHAGTVTPIAIALTGSATAVTTTAPAASIAPTSLAFASTPIGSTSSTQNVTVSNTGNAALDLTAIAYGSTDFFTAGGTCAVPGTLAAGASCTLAVAFRPANGATGTRSGTLSLSHNAAGSPGSVALNGSAAAALAPVAALTPSLNFGSVNVGSTGSAQTATLANTGTAPLVIAAIGTGSSEFSAGGGTCSAGASVAAGASCTVAVTFTPASAGARSATLTVTHNAGSGSSTSALAGTGVALTPVASVSPTSLAFSQTVGSTSAAQTVTLSNTGTAPLSISSLAIGGAQAAEFAVATGGTCSAGGSVAANSSCTVRVSFTPAATGTRSATLAIAHNAGASPSNVALNGTGTAAPQPAIALSAASLVFASQTVGTPSAAQSVTVSNSGQAPLTFGSFALAGTAATDFARSGSCAPSGTLAAGASCSVSFAFTPTATGTRTATLTIASDASNGSAVLSLTGSGAAVPMPAVALAPSALDFGNQPVGSASGARSVTLSNTGSGALSLGGITATPGFGVSHACGTSLAAGASCALSVTFAPTTSGAVAGSLAVSSNATGSPHSVALAGNGVVASPVLAWTPAAATFDFGSASVGGSGATQTLTLTNQGPGSVTLQQLTLAGAQATDFAFGAASTCSSGVTLAAGANCTLVVGFQPGAAGPRSATLQVSSSGTNPPDVALAGTGSSTVQPSAAVMPSALSFAVPKGVTSVAAQELMIESAGSAALRVLALRVAAGSFALEAATSQPCQAPPFDLLPGQACKVAVAWSNPTGGSETGAVEIDSNATEKPLSVPVTAVRETAQSISNVGAGGCSISTRPSATDPTLWVLVALAIVVLWARRAQPARPPAAPLPLRSNRTPSSRPSGDRP